MELLGPLLPDPLLPLTTDPELVPPNGVIELLGPLPPPIHRHRLWTSVEHNDEAGASSVTFSIDVSKGAGEFFESLQWSVANIMMHSGSVHTLSSLMPAIRRTARTFATAWSAYSMTVLPTGHST
jgi:hypothetical protein